MKTFLDVDECVDFVTNFDDNAECTMIVNDVSDGRIMPLIHSLTSVKAIYILVSSKEQWINEDYTKVCGVYTDIQSLCDHFSNHRTNYAEVGKILKQ